MWALGQKSIWFFGDFSIISCKYGAEKKWLLELSHKAVLDWTYEIKG